VMMSFINLKVSLWSTLDALNANPRSTSEMGGRTRQEITNIKYVLAWEV